MGARLTVPRKLEAVDDLAERASVCTAVDQVSSLAGGEAGCTKINHCEKVGKFDQIVDETVAPAGNTAGQAPKTGGLTIHRLLSPQQAFANWKKDQFEERLGVTTRDVSRVLGELGHSLEVHEVGGVESDEPEKRLGVSATLVSHGDDQDRSVKFEAVVPNLKHKCCEAVVSVNCPSGEYVGFYDKDHSYNCNVLQKTFARPLGEKQVLVEKDRAPSKWNKKGYAIRPAKKVAEKKIKARRSINLGDPSRITDRVCAVRHVCGVLESGPCVGRGGRRLPPANKWRSGRPCLTQHTYRTGYTEQLERAIRIGGERAGVLIKTSTGPRDIPDPGRRENVDSGASGSSVSKPPETVEVNWSLPRKVGDDSGVDCLCRKRILEHRKSELEKKLPGAVGKKVTDSYKQSSRPGDFPRPAPGTPDSSDTDEAGGPSKQLAAYREAVERSLRNALGLNQSPATTIEEQRRKEQRLENATEAYFHAEFDEKETEVETESRARCSAEVRGARCSAETGVRRARVGPRLYPDLARMESFD